jgi:hypothetical protein
VITLTLGHMMSFGADTEIPFSLRETASTVVRCSRYKTRIESILFSEAMGGKAR